MANGPQDPAPEGWYPSPDGVGERYWHGSSWSHAYRHPTGRRPESGPPPPPRPTPSAPSGPTPEPRRQPGAEPAPATQEQGTGRRPLRRGRRGRLPAWTLWAFGALTIGLAVAGAVVLITDDEDPSKPTASEPAGGGGSSGDTDPGKPPRVEVAIRQDGATVSSPRITIEGQATVKDPRPRGRLTVTVNGRRVKLARQGRFLTPVDLDLGSNSIVVRVTYTGAAKLTKSASITRVAER